ncbi:MAG: type II toxin-antitoxin system VapC family toxin, partial [Thermomicrobiales bacterium]
MVSRYLLDTDRIIDALNGIPEASETLTGLAATGVAVSLISYGELYEGAYYARDQVGALAALAAFVRDKPLLEVTKEILERFAIIRGSLSRQLRRQIGDMDLIIAATALTHDLTLV